MSTFCEKKLSLLLTFFAIFAIISYNVRWVGSSMPFREHGVGSERTSFCRQKIFAEVLNEEKHL